jgi:hypothetical protein
MVTVMAVPGGSITLDEVPRESWYCERLGGAAWGGPGLPISNIVTETGPLVGVKGRETYISVGAERLGLISG